MIKIKLAVAYLTAMLAVAPTKELRYFLNGIHLNAKDKRLEATDGTVALTINYPLPDELGDNIILPSEFIAACVKVAKAAKQDYITVEYNPTDGSLKTPLHNSDVLDGQFPTLDRVFPGNYDQKPRAIDTKFINVFHNVMKPLVAVHDAKKREKTPIAWNPEYGNTNGGKGCAVMKWKDVTFIAMELRLKEEHVFTTADVLARLSD